MICVYCTHLAIEFGIQHRRNMNLQLVGCGFTGSVVLLCGTALAALLAIFDSSPQDGCAALTLLCMGRRRRYHLPRLLHEQERLRRKIKTLLEHTQLVSCHTHHRSTVSTRPGIQHKNRALIGVSSIKDHTHALLLPAFFVLVFDEHTLSWTNLGHRRAREQRVEQRFDMTEGQALHLQEGRRALGDHSLVAVQHNEATTSELPPTRHVSFRLDIAQGAVLQLQL